MIEEPTESDASIATVSLDLTVGEARSHAQRVLDRASLAFVIQTAGDVRSKYPPVEGTLNVESGLHVQTGYEDGEVAIVVRYRTAATLDGPEDATAPVAWQVGLEYLASFAVSGDLGEAGEPLFTAVELHCFGILIGPPTIHPFAREAMQNLTSRGPYPAFTMDMLTPLSAFPDDTQLSQIESI